LITSSFRLGLDDRSIVYTITLKNVNEKKVHEKIKIDKERPSVKKKRISLYNQSVADREGIFGLRLFYDYFID
jgi:hypothetical protein